MKRDGVIGFTIGKTGGSAGTLLGAWAPARKTGAELARGPRCGPEKPWLPRCVRTEPALLTQSDPIAAAQPLGFVFECLCWLLI